MSLLRMRDCLPVLIETAGGTGDEVSIHYRHAATQREAIACTQYVPLLSGLVPLASCQCLRMDWELTYQTLTSRTGPRELPGSWGATDRRPLRRTNTNGHWTTANRQPSCRAFGVPGSCGCSRSMHRPRLRSEGSGHSQGLPARSERPLSRASPGRSVDPGAGYWPRRVSP